ncbi:HI0074 family nucleotidyltransferase substrate-binding subunit [uncultured Ruegeria sp.]|uniref:HI0074 family nucleotidyltransferase substrate-binding subunit n=1 Tax=uncultured Ruegeria sp. TaxID=259304 RepID=UPI0026200B0E|nr:HI0074 family nucleotidyltransferase substrate-binding subunit [uncultured Ruegeria sp.]
MSARRLKDSLGNLQKAVAKLEDALAIPRDRELVFEGTIQRYEVAIELTWKTIFRALKYEGVSVEQTPRKTLEKAFQLDWISDDDLWLDMVSHRNTTSHEYLAEELLEENYDDVVKVTPTMREMLQFLESRYAEILASET